MYDKWKKVFGDVTCLMLIMDRINVFHSEVTGVFREGHAQYLLERMRAVTSKRKVFEWRGKRGMKSSGKQMDALFQWICFEIIDKFSENSFKLL